MTQTFVYFDDCFKGHVQSLDYPECSDRVQNIIELINKEEFKNNYSIHDHLRAIFVLFYYYSNLINIMHQSNITFQNHKLTVDYIIFNLRNGTSQI